MKTKFNLLKAVLIVLLLNTAFASAAMSINLAENGKISGTIRDAFSQKTLEYVSVTIYSATDSSMIAGTITNNDGSFYLSMLGAGNYFLEISEPGFRKIKTETVTIHKEEPKINLGVLHLEPLIIAGNKSLHKKQ